jgi:methyl-accepting chemotaxis protein
MLSHLKLSSRMYLLSFLGALGLIVIYGFALLNLHHCLLDGRKAKLQNLVDYAHTQLSYYDEEAKSGAITLEQAQKLAKESLRKARYDGNEYFWLNDLQPKILMHPVRPQNEGKDQSDNKDPAGKAIYLEFLKIAKEKGAGFVDYVGVKPDSKDVQPKLSYVKLYAPWGWVIGTGIYIDDLEKEFRSQALQLGGIVLLTIIISIVLGRFIRRSIIGEFGGEPRDAMHIARQIAQGDLSGKVPLQAGDKSSLLYVLAQMQENLRGVLQAIGCSSRNVQSSLEKLSSESNQITLATQLQASVVRGTRDGVMELSASVDVVNSLASDTQASSQEVAQRSKAGASLANKVSSEMQSIATMVEKSSGEVAHLVARMQEINKMATVIKEIADQTNLLALNAAIEAARAGEQGRGFAVVADEVRKLAERTTTSTIEISQILQAIQSETTRAVSGMNEAAPVIAAGVEQSNIAAQTLREIEDHAIDSLDKMQKLAESTSLQARRIAEIVDQVDQVTESTVRADEAIRQSQETSTSLEHEASELFEMTKRFKLGNESLEPTLGQPVQQIRPLMEWSAALAVGFGEIDRQHQRLVEIANELNSAMHSGAGAQVAGKILNELVDYTVKHFAYEEGEMKKHSYPQREAHFEEHRKLVAEVSAFKQKFDSGQAAISVELLGFIRDWLLNHILKVDKSLARYFNSLGMK